MTLSPLWSLRAHAYALPHPVAVPLRRLARATSDTERLVAAAELAKAAAQWALEAALSEYRESPEVDAALDQLAEAAFSEGSAELRWQAAVALLNRPTAAAFGGLRALAAGNDEGSSQWRKAFGHLLSLSQPQALSRERFGATVRELDTIALVEAAETVAGGLRGGGCVPLRVEEALPQAGSGEVVALLVVTPEVGFRAPRHTLGLRVSGKAPALGSRLLLDVGDGALRDRPISGAVSDAPPEALGARAYGPDLGRVVELLARPSAHDLVDPIVADPAARFAPNPQGSRGKWLVSARFDPGTAPVLRRLSALSRSGGSLGDTLLRPLNMEWQPSRARVDLTLDGSSDVTLAELLEDGSRVSARTVVGWLSDLADALAELSANGAPQPPVAPEHVVIAGERAWLSAASLDALGEAHVLARGLGATLAALLRALALPEPGLDSIARKLEGAKTGEEAFGVLEESRGSLAAQVSDLHPGLSQRLSGLIDPPAAQDPSVLGGDEEAAAALEAAADALWSPERRARLFEAAALAHERAGHGDKAQSTWEKLVDEAPDHATALGRLAEGARGAGQLQLAVELSKQRLECASTLEERLEALHEATTLAAEAQQRERALELAAALALEGADDTEALTAAALTALSQRDWARAFQWALQAGTEDLCHDVGHALLLESERAAQSGAKNRSRRLAAQAIVLEPTLADKDVAYKLLAPPATVLTQVAPITPEQRRARLEEQLETTTEDETRAAVLASLIGDAALLGISAADRARYQEQLLKLRPHDRALLAAVQEQRTSEGNWRDVERLLERRERLADTDAERRDLALERARLLRKRLGKGERAFVLLSDLAGQFPRDVEILEALAEVAQSLGRWEALLRAQVSRAELLAGAERAELFAAAASVAQNQVGSDSRAAALYAQALEANPEHVPAARELSALYRQQGELEKALPLLEAWARGTQAALAPEEALAAWLSCAELAEQLVHLDTAAAAYGKVIELDRHHVDAHLALARIQRELGRGKDAEGTLRALLALPEDKVDTRARATAQAQLGELSLASGSLEESRVLWLDAHRREPTNPTILRELVLACDHMQRWRDSVAFRLDLAKLAVGDEAKYLALMEAADIARKQLGDTDTATRSYYAAHQVRPDVRPPLAALVELYIESGQTALAAQTLTRLVDLETDRARKAQTALATALMYRDHLYDNTQAASMLERALEYDPLRLEAFEALDQLLANQEKFVGERAQAYERMIQRLDGVDDAEPVVLKLLLNMGKLWASSGRSVQAEAACRRAIALMPASPLPWLALAEVWEGLDSSSDRAIDALQRALELGATGPEPYRALRKLFARSKRPDAAWCACGVLVHLGSADEKESTFYAGHKTGALRVARTVRDPELWRKHLYAGAIVADLGSLFETLYQSIPQLFLGPQGEQPRIRTAARIDLSDRSTFSGFAATIPRILGVPVPKYFRATSTIGIRKALQPELGLMVSQDMLDSGRGKFLRFCLGRAIAQFHEPLLVHGFLAPSELLALVEALYPLVVGSAPPKEDEAAARWYNRLDALVPPASRPALATLAGPYFRGGSAPDVAAWCRLSQFTINRAGLLLCNDVEVAAEGIQAFPQEELGASMEEQIGDLLRYAVSAPYHELRAYLGIAVQ